MKGTCTWRGCDRPIYAKGLCCMHYGRKRDGMDMDAPEQCHNKGHVCSVQGCTRPATAKGLCGTHYKRTLDGAPLDPPIHPRAPQRGVVCSACGCGSPAYSRGLCRRHYMARYRGSAIIPDRTGEPDGYGHYGIVDRDADGHVVCHECGRSFRSLGHHVGKAHMPMAEYRRRHGLTVHQRATDEDFHERRSARSRAIAIESYLGRDRTGRRLSASQRRAVSRGEQLAGQHRRYEMRRS